MFVRTTEALLLSSNRHTQMAPTVQDALENAGNRTYKAISPVPWRDTESFYIQDRVAEESSGLVL